MISTAFIQSRHQHQHIKLPSKLLTAPKFLVPEVRFLGRLCDPACNVIQIASLSNLIFLYQLRNLKTTWNKHDTTIVITKDWRSFKVTVKLKAKTTEAKVPWPVLDEAPIRWIKVRCLCLWSLENSQKVISLAVQTAQIQTRNTPGSISIASLSLCRAAVRADLHRIFGCRTSVDPNKRKGNEWNERLGSLACGWLGWRDQRCPSPFTSFTVHSPLTLALGARCCPKLRPPLLQHAPKSTNGWYLRRDWLHGMCGNHTYPWAWSWLVHQQESKHWVITASKSKLALNRLKTSRILGGKRVNIPRPWKYLFTNFAKPVQPKLRVTESASKIVHAVPGHTL